MIKEGLKLNTFNLILGIVGGIVTIIASIGGSYVTTQVVLAKHDIMIEVNTSSINKNTNSISEVESKIDDQLIILNKIATDVAVIEERTKK